MSVTKKLKIDILELLFDFLVEHCILIDYKYEIFDIVKKTILEDSDNYCIFDFVKWKIKKDFIKKDWCICDSYCSTGGFFILKCLSHIIFNYYKNIPIERRLDLVKKTYKDFFTFII